MIIVTQLEEEQNKKKTGHFKYYEDLKYSKDDYC